uniref:JmjC domain-containing protein n=1 Tax=Octactis speculum TaxID=3111310 RepID=A0A7S2GJF2_9STRA|mmetsp:Transcript_48557/g.66108  ORF Transcript_48557/g.66108 Transcript_48557/m.66108 type:complete len:383 (+) Transcript_48557:59-1207(+)
MLRKRGYVACGPIVAALIVILVSNREGSQLDTKGWLPDTGVWFLHQLITSLLPFAPPRSWRTTDAAIWQRYQDAHGTKEAPMVPIDEPNLASLLAGETKLDLSRPAVLRGALNLTHLGWGLDWLAESPRGDMVVDYFSDASIPAKEGGSVPRSRAALRDIVSAFGIENATIFPKVGTEMVFHKYPHLLQDLPLDKYASIFGYRWFDPRYVGTLLTVPVFLSRGTKAFDTASSKGDDDDDDDAEITTTTTTKASSRTDLHCEPITNVCLHLVGRKRWTLVDPADSPGLRPALSPDGRAYVFANLDPDDPAITRVRRYSAMLEAGDILYVPAWWWHRVDYIEDQTALSMSLFHVNFEQMLGNNKLFFALVVPNLVKEVLGWNKQ